MRGFVAFGILIAGQIGFASAGEMKSPRISPVAVDWDAARSELSKVIAGETQSDAPNAVDTALARVNEAAESQFAGVGQSAVPVLVPFHSEAVWRGETPSPGAKGTFRVRFFFAGPTGYDAVFSVPADLSATLSGRARKENVAINISGFSVLYDLDVMPASKPVKELEDQFPGIRRTWHESNVRYSFRRYGVPYVVSMLCVDGPARGRWLACRDADRIIARFLSELRIAGGTPQQHVSAAETIARPEQVSPDFIYAPPGGLLEKTGFRGRGGRADDTVYAKVRFPIAEGPAFANSQSFMNWGNCDFTGRTSRSTRKGAAYRCKVNSKPLVFDESAAENRAYPWRDNFCEHRHFFVGQCPGGKGHQGQDIRPATCKLRNSGADRCLPYQDEVVAVRDGMIMRTPGRELMHLVVNMSGERVRFRYLHMNPRMLDADGMVYGRKVREGETLGKVGNYDKKENGTTYHLHFDLQVPTEYGWVLVNPYMTLVAGYERLIGGRGRELSDEAVVAGTPVNQPAQKNAQEMIAIQPADKAAEHTESVDTAARAGTTPHVINTPVAR